MPFSPPHTSERAATPEGGSTSPSTSAPLLTPAQYLNDRQPPRRQGLPGPRGSDHCPVASTTRVPVAQLTDTTNGAYVVAGSAKRKLRLATIGGQNARPPRHTDSSQAKPESAQRHRASSQTEQPWRTGEGEPDGQCAPRRSAALTPQNRSARTHTPVPLIASATSAPLKRIHHASGQICRRMPDTRNPARLQRPHLRDVSSAEPCSCAGMPPFPSSSRTRPCVCGAQWGECTTVATTPPGPRSRHRTGPARPPPTTHRRWS